MINKHFSSYFELDGHSPVFVDGESKSLEKGVKVVGGIPRFSPDVSYSSGNFSLLREKHATLQLDSVNGTEDRRNTILRRTNWPANFFEGKTVLECGCGAGADTEVLLSLGANVISVDLAGVDVAAKNVNHPRVQFVQADITSLPFKKECFDVVFCHRVLQHTPDPEETVKSILKHLRPGGAVFIHSYAKTFFQMFRWKYFLRPLTKRMDSDSLYRLIGLYAKPAFHFTNLLNKNLFTRYIAWVGVPFLNYRHIDKFSGKSDQYIIEYGIHDTFDALSPKYDRPISPRRLAEIADPFLKSPYEIIKGPTITLLRSKIS